MGVSRLITAGTLVAALVACTDHSADAPASGSEQCQGRGQNLLQDPDFATIGGSRRERQWFHSQHGGEPSFEHSASNGELLIEKTGSEPWFILTQIIQRADIPGRRVVFSAEIKLDLHPPAIPHAFKQGGGLTVTAMANGKPVLRSLMEHEPHMGTTDWQPVQVVLELPKQVQSVRLGFIHQADGSMRVRNPALKRIARDDCDG
ncbi:hypothetical protein DWB85_10955 [Seongchinamella sediminis]|uniref:Uncharacterized protein n=1 Tax=Seongchinamella sediminis TaxID=2283635 RepID=A0A3L7DW40_9GAMM|nr:hypothetical protein [Seongchinamella sediminis]RLQ21798.1 hypothetical protein DWB85_10955 [Seongchinamella sediminis]